MDTGEESHIPAFSKLPAELIAWIFELSLPSLTDLELESRITPETYKAIKDGARSRWPLATEAPLNITHVSREWRQLALSTQALWSSIDLGKALAANEKGVSLGVLEQWLIRSGTHPLKIAFFADIDAITSPNIWLLMLENAPRWVELHIAITCNPLLDELKGALSLAIKLRVLTLRLLGGVSENTPRLDVSALVSLEELTLTGLHRSLKGSDIYLPIIRPPRATLQKLTTAVLQQDMSTSDAIQWLASCPEIEVLHCIISETRGNVIHEKTAYSLPRLRLLDLLVLDGSPRGLSPSFFEYIHFPSLKDLVIGSARGSGWPSSLLGALTRSNPPLLRLTFHGGIMASYPEILPILKLVENLMPREVDGQLVIELLPRLESLSVQVDHTELSSVPALLDLLCSRWDFFEGKVFKEALIHLSKYFNWSNSVFETHSKLKRCRDLEGLKVTAYSNCSSILTAVEESLY
ncbi:hypothetical protein DFH11DRAFT_1177566 [Phellopilus nigrolimitatus]|nr:hypothetical protein DFH11DRAFT_1177566 [Phellopilus nigrolimitatus]